MTPMRYLEMVTELTEARISYRKFPNEALKSSIEKLDLAVRKADASLLKHSSSRMGGNYMSALSNKLPLFLLLVLMFASCSEPCSGSKDELHADYLTAMNNCGWSADCRAEVERQYEKRMENACD